MNNEFYVGYVPKAPPGIAQRIRVAVFAAFIVAVVIALALVIGQNAFPNATFDYDQPKLFNGVIRRQPVPSIELRSGALALLVAPGKHGADSLITGLEGKRVDLMGNRIQRGADVALEIVPDSIRITDAVPAPASVWTNVGSATLRGEVADSKCYLGVMNPGEGKVHRDCAARCISGGIPPVFIVADRDGRRRVLLLTAPGGLDPNRLLPYVAEPMVLTGTLYRSGTSTRFEIDPNTLRHAE
jgi:hypothetical protein